jgi:carboxyl-terminal processing protease
MKSKSLLYTTVALVAVIFLVGACSTGFLAGRYFTPDLGSGISLFPGGESPSASSQESNPENSSGTAGAQVDREELFKPFWETWDIIHDQYVDQPVDDEALMRGAIQGMIDSLGDQHSSYMDPNQYRQANIPLQQEYEGIGAFVDTDTEYLTILSPIPDTPAEKAGLRPGDEIIAVDGEDMTGIAGQLVLRRVLGEAGTKVRLTIRRQAKEGVEPEVFDVEIVRAKINIPSVTGEMLENDIAYVQVIQFAVNTRSELRKTLNELLDQNPSGMILDLRNNGGGYLDTAVEVSSEFIDNGVVLIEEFGDGKRETFKALGNGLATEIPLVVLVNEGTASASEIVAGAIQDYGRGRLVGVTTYGKGSVQNWVPLSGDNGAVRITIARWLTPKERQIHELGLTPDVEVELTEEDFKAGRDPQLDKAIELLQTGA